MIPRWDRVPIGPFMLPASLEKRLLPWVKHGHDAVAHGIREMFVRVPRSSRPPAPFKNTDLSAWFRELLAKIERPAPVNFPPFSPSNLRHIFVDERCCEDSVQGPANRAAARIMGNSEARYAPHAFLHTPAKN